MELSKRAKITALEICKQSKNKVLKKGAREYRCNTVLANACHVQLINTSYDYSGNFGSAFVEVLVCDPSCPDQEVTLLPVSTLMSVQESRTGRNKNKTALYTKDKLSGSATSKKWNQIKIRCIQKYNLDAQFGLRSISFFTDSRDPASGVTDRTLASSLASRPSVMTPSASTPKQETPPSDQQRHKYPSLPSSAPVVTSNLSRIGPSLKDKAKLKPQTPNRPKSQHVVRSEGEEDYEFSGIEKQSRLFHGCVGQKSDEKSDVVKGSNQILEKISAEKEKYRKALEPQYQRKKLLKKDLPKAEALTMRDFVESYKESKSSAELAGACRKLSSHGIALLNNCIKFFFSLKCRR